MIGRRVCESVALWGVQGRWANGERPFPVSNLNCSREVTVCGLRSSYKARRRTRVLSKESIQVIHALKLAKSPEHVLNAKLSRLLKPDALNLFDELLRQNQLDLALKATQTFSFNFNHRGLFFSFI
ncbi:unnamed protein product [Sphenostylis stenocarpa]|uniref:Uncharacterized protein n=1 Tax=Sphenostylis stenocarpa TaxID=92480 RepID=A0AA86SED1_9FABA|nr:unnamed protein product [Sphenostylis stenocarpa]